MRLADLFVRLSLDNKDFQSGVDQAQRRMQTFSNTVGNIGRTLTAAITLPLIGAGTAAVKMAMNAVESENLFEQSMGGMADSAREWSEELRKELGLNAYEVRKNVGTFNVMFESMGMGKKAALDMSKGLTQLSYDMASFYNLRPEEAFQKLQAGITGEIEPLKRLGIVINETTIATYAYTHGIAEQGQKLTEQQKILARYGVIMEATSKAQGDLARTLDSPTNQFRILQERITYATTELGKSLLPTVQEVMSDAITPLADKVLKLAEAFTEMDEPAKKAVVRNLAILASIGPLALGVSLVTKAFASLSPMVKLAGNTMGGIIGVGSRTVFAFQAVRGGAATLGESLMYVGGAPAKAFSSAIAGIGKSLTWLAAHPVVAVVAALAALGAAFVFARNRAKQAMEDMVNAELAKIQEGIEQEKQGALELVTAKEEAAVKSYEKRKALLDKEYQAAKDNIQKEVDAQKNALQQRLDILEREHDAVIDALREEYGVYKETTKSKMDLARDEAENAIRLLDQQAERARELHKERMRQLEEQALAAVDEETRRAIEALEDQIDAIDELTEAEEKAERQRRDAERTAMLQAKIEQEQDAERRAELEQELQEHLTEVQRRALLEQREAEKDALREQIETVRKTAEERKEEIRNGLNEELEEKKRVETEKLDLTLAKIEEERVAIQTALQEKLLQLEAERLEKERIENEKFELAKGSLERELSELDKALQLKQTKMDEEYQRKLEHEERMYEALVNRLADERQAVTEHYDAIARSAAVAEQAAARAQQAFEAAQQSQAAASAYWYEQGTLPGDIAPPVAGLKKFHAGGVFRAPRPGGEGLAILRDGERITPGGMLGPDPFSLVETLKKALSGANAAANGGVTVNVYDNNFADGTDAGNRIASALRRAGIR